MMNFKKARGSNNVMTDQNGSLETLEKDANIGSEEG